MADKKTKARKPDYRAKIDVPCWKNKDKNGKEYLSVKLFGTSINLFMEGQ